MFIAQVLVLSTNENKTKTGTEPCSVLEKQAMQKSGNQAYGGNRRSLISLRPRL